MNNILFYICSQSRIFERLFIYIDISFVNTEWLTILIIEVHLYLKLCNNFWTISFYGVVINLLYRVFNKLIEKVTKYLIKKEEKRVIKEMRNLLQAVLMTQLNLITHFVLKLIESGLDFEILTQYIFRLGSNHTSSWMGLT